MWPRSSKFLARRACHGRELSSFLVPADTSKFGPPVLHLLIFRPGHPKSMKLILVPFS